MGTTVNKRISIPTGNRTPIIQKVVYSPYSVNPINEWMENISDKSYRLDIQMWYSYARTEVLIVVTMISSVYCDVTPGSFAESNLHGILMPNVSTIITIKILF
jgi:hypothetical protein